MVIYTNLLCSKSVMELNRHDRSDWDAIYV